MSKEKHIEETAKDICRICRDYTLCEKEFKPCVLAKREAEALYTAGYRKQSEGEWVSYVSPICLSGDLYYKCSICGTNDPYQHTTKRAKFCPNCGAKMKGGAE